MFLNQTDRDNNILTTIYLHWKIIWSLKTCNCIIASKFYWVTFKTSVNLINASIVSWSCLQTSRCHFTDQIRAAGSFSWPNSFNPVTMATTIKDADDFKDSALLVAVKRIAYFSCIYFFIIIYSLTFRSLVSEAGTVNSEHVTNLSLGTSGNVVQRTSCHWSCGAHLFYFYVGNFYLVFYQLFCAILFYIFFLFVCLRYL